MKNNIKYIIIGICVVALLISLFTAFRNKVNGDYKELIKSKDETIKAIEGQRDIYKQVIAEKNRELEQHFKNDSILAKQSKQLTVKYEKIPVYINSLDREGIRNAITNY